MYFRPSVFIELFSSGRELKRWRPSATATFLVQWPRCYKGQSDSNRSCQSPRRRLLQCSPLPPWNNTHILGWRRILKTQESISSTFYLHFFEYENKIYINFSHLLQFFLADAFGEILPKYLKYVIKVKGKC